MAPPTLKAKLAIAAVSSSNIADPDTAVVYVYNPVNGTTVVEGTAVTTNNNQCNSPGSNAISFVVSP